MTAPPTEPAPKSKTREVVSTVALASVVVSLFGVGIRYGFVGDPPDLQHSASAYVEAIRGGAPTSLAGKGSDVDAALDAIKASTSHRIGKSTALTRAMTLGRLDEGSGCSTAHLTTGGVEAPVAILFEVREHRWWVVDVGQARKCSCDGTDSGSCRLTP